MSRTYRYPRESLDDSIIRNESDVRRKIQEKLARQKQQRKKRSKAARALDRSFRKMISYRDTLRASVRTRD